MPGKTHPAAEYLRDAARTAEQRTAAAMDSELEQLAATAQRNGISDARWNKLALALLGVRQFTRPLMHDGDRRKT